jgi:hypothetical protein
MDCASPWDTRDALNTTQCQCTSSVVYAKKYVELRRLCPETVQPFDLRRWTLPPLRKRRRGAAKESDHCRGRTCDPKLRKLVR